MKPNEAKPREWRKLFLTILDSERFATLSDGATCLLFLLIVAQDDTGYYPWEPAKIKHLVTGRPWSLEDTNRHAEELEGVGLISRRDNGFYLRNGEELNGNPRPDRPSFLYPRSTLLLPEGRGQTTVDESLNGDQALPSYAVPAVPPDGHSPSHDGHVTTADGHSTPNVRPRKRIDKDRDRDKETTSAKADVAKKAAATASTNRGPRRSKLKTILSDPEELRALFEESELLDLQSRFPHADLDVEMRNCLDWHNEIKRGSKNWRVALRNWLGNVREPAQNGARPRDGPGAKRDGKLPTSVELPADYAAQLTGEPERDVHVYEKYRLDSIRGSNRE